MHPPRCPYRGNASALWALRGLHNKIKWGPDEHYVSDFAFNSYSIPPSINCNSEMRNNINLKKFTSC